MTTCKKMRLQVLKHYYSIENAVACIAHGQISDIITFNQTHIYSLGLSLGDWRRWLNNNVQSFYDESCSHESVRIHKFQFVVKCCPLGWHGMAWHHTIHFLTHWQHIKCWSFFLEFSSPHVRILFNYYYFIKCVRVGMLRECVSAIFPKSMLWIFDSEWFIEDTERYVEPFAV